MKEVYLDNSATTMAYRSVGELVQKVMCEDQDCDKGTTYQESDSPYPVLIINVNQ